MTDRASGILLHVTSLPCKFGIGDLGPGACRFIDFLKEAGQKYWQVLPLNPTELYYGNSPYSCPSSFAGNPLLISPEVLISDGYLDSSDIPDLSGLNKRSVNYELAHNIKAVLLKKAFELNRDSIVRDPEFKHFCLKEDDWLRDYVLYETVKETSGSATWKEFPKGLKERHSGELIEIEEAGDRIIAYKNFLQYIFFKQWSAVKSYAQDNGISIIGDIPYYVNYDSSDVWANQRLFKLDGEKDPEFVAGVPPDYFSDTGQLWGNPVYDWDKLKDEGYSWWISRIGHNLSMFGKLRLDHFRGFVSYWEIEAGEETALNGKWVHLDCYDFFETLFSEFEKEKFIAEDLGYITQDVKDLINHYGLPGMKILLFAFGDEYPYGDYLPSNIQENCVIYTGTHDNNTVCGWWNEEAGDAEKQRIREYLSKDVEDSSVNWDFIGLGMDSKAKMAIFPMQDIIGLGRESRMNTPATKSGNWQWRVIEEELTLGSAKRLKELVVNSGRG